jgi:hypothetical protein
VPSLDNASAQLLMATARRTMLTHLDEPDLATAEEPLSARGTTVGGRSYIPE